MAGGWSLALALVAGTGGEPPAAAATAPAEPPAAAAEPPASAKPAARCASAPPTNADNEIVVCGQRHQGYRIDPDILKVDRQKRSGGRRKRPERLADTSCAVVGPAGCNPAAGINLVGAATAAATMLGKAMRGENVGEMFVTNPEPSDYQLYIEAKREREAREAEAAARARARAAAAAATAPPAAQAKAAEPAPQ